MYFCPWALCLCGDSICSEKIGEAWNDPTRWIAFWIKGICWVQNLVAIKDGFAVGVMAWLLLDWCRFTLDDKPVTIRRVVGSDIIGTETGCQR